VARRGQSHDAGWPLKEARKPLAEVGILV